MCKLDVLAASTAIFLCQIAVVQASVGDQSWTFQKCLKGCEGRVCSKISDTNYRQQQPFHMRWLQWTCSEECEYQCMWKTVDAFQKDGSGIPQFHGKWPFIRIFGIQEPASVIFSILNGIVHVFMIIHFHRKVSSSTPMYYIWHIYAAVAINAWFWSTIFHSRDTAFTELMDYTCAISLVFYSFLGLVVRVIGTANKLKVATCSAPILGFFIYHVHYLVFVKFDYGYNMEVNVAIGGINAGGWLWWCYAVRKNQPYVWKGALTIFLLSFLILLELGDFPPIWWTFDAHSLWHAGTVLLPVLWYRFLVEDCTFLLESQKKKLPIDNVLYNVSESDKKKL